MFNVMSGNTSPPASFSTLFSQLNEFDHYLCKFFAQIILSVMQDVCDSHEIFILCPGYFFLIDVPDTGNREVYNLPGPGYRFL